jgi:hypothetical protein
MAAKKRQALLLVGLLLAASTAEAEGAEATRLGKSWTTPEKDLALSIEAKESSHVICPHLPDSTHQPFCRQFAAEPVSVCGHRDALQLVLTNGEVHRVNSALIGIDGSFEPAFSPDAPLQLQKAWTPNESCHPDHGLVDVVAVSVEGDLWHFTGSAWNRISGRRTTHSF